MHASGNKLNNYAAGIHVAQAIIIEKDISESSEDTCSAREHNNKGNGKLNIMLGHASIWQHLELLSQAQAEVLNQHCQLVGGQKLKTHM
jgi:hypothetical protein